MSNNTQLVCLRLDNETLNGIDALIAAKEFDTRAGAIRYAINKLLLAGGRKL